LRILKIDKTNRKIIFDNISTMIGYTSQMEKNLKDKKIPIITKNVAINTIICELDIIYHLTRGEQLYGKLVLDNFLTC